MDVEIAAEREERVEIGVERVEAPLRHDLGAGGALHHEPVAEFALEGGRDLPADQVGIGAVEGVGNIVPAVPRGDLAVFEQAFGGDALDTSAF